MGTLVITYLVILGTVMIVLGVWLRKVHPHWGAPIAIGLFFYAIAGTIVTVSLALAGMP